MKLYVRKSGDRSVYGCPSTAKGTVCPTPGIGADLVEEYITEQFLNIVGAHPETEEVEIVTDPGTVGELAEVGAAIKETSAALAEDDADLAVLLERLSVLKERRLTLRAPPAAIERKIRKTGRTLREAWGATEDVDKKRELLLEGLDHVRVSSRTRRGNVFEPDRLEILWNS